MYEPKTKPTNVPVTDYINAIEDESRRKDCKELVKLMTRVTGCKPKMWGASIVGFDSYHYRYESGHEGDSAIVGFSSRAKEIVVYIVAGYEGAESLLAKLGKHRIGKSCLYIKRLADIQLPVLEELVRSGWKQTLREYPRSS